MPTLKNRTSELGSEKIPIDIIGRAKTSGQKAGHMKPEEKQAQEERNKPQAKETTPYKKSRGVYGD